LLPVLEPGSMNLETTLLPPGGGSDIPAIEPCDRLRTKAQNGAARVHRSRMRARSPNLGNAKIPGKAETLQWCNARIRSWAMERPTLGGPAKRLPAPAMAAKEREQAGPGMLHLIGAARAARPARPTKEVR
jgi:hypothetical protein